VAYQWRIVASVSAMYVYQRKRNGEAMWLAGSNDGISVTISAASQLSNQ